MRNAVSEIKKALGVVGQNNSFIGVVSTVGPNGITTVTAGGWGGGVLADWVLCVGDEVMFVGWGVVWFGQKGEFDVWVDLIICRNIEKNE